ncbi:MAG TPA: hypothetical protein VFR40_00775 [Lapillicoccus sp.]|nr:hypothetical protein [Lapillicoccus sp.]
MLIVLLDEAVGAVRTGVGLVVGREWLREPGVEGAQCGRVGLVVILVVISSYVSSDLGGWWSSVARQHGEHHVAVSKRRCFLVVRWRGAGRVERRPRGPAPRGTPASAPMFQGRRTV